MKITSIQTNNSIATYNKQKQYNRAEVNKKVGSDKVVISEQAKYLNEINSEINDIDINKINEIKNRLKSGTYSIDSKDIAKKIIQSIKGE